MFALRFHPWRNISAIGDKAALRAWLESLAKRSHFIFRAGMEASRGGKVYTHQLRWIGGRIVPVGPRGRPHRASKPGDWPAVDSGALKGSIRTEVTQWSMTIGTSRPYSKHLLGTPGGLIAPRKMSKDALQAGRAGAGPITFAKFRIG